MSMPLDRDRHVGRTLGSRLVLLVLVTAALVWCGSAMAQEGPVASFEAQPGREDHQPSGENGATVEPTLSFSFRFAPWEQVLIKFADVADLTLDLTDVPGGTFNYYDKGRYTPREALDILNGYLLQRGFVLVRRDRFLVCVNIEKGIPANLIPLVTVDDLADYGENALASVLLSGEGLDATLAASQIEQLQGSHGKVVVMSGTNSLLVTDTGGNLRLFQRLLAGGAFKRRASSGAGPAFRSFALQYVRADDTERLIRKMFGLPTGASSSAAADSRSPALAGLNITTDPRTNQLFVAATSAQLASIEQIVEAYDVGGTSTDDAPRRGAPTTRLLPLPNADLIIIGRALESLSPRIRVSTTRSARRPTAAAPATDKPTAETPGGTAPPPATPKATDGR